MYLPSRMPRVAPVIGAVAFEKSNSRQLMHYDHITSDQHLRDFCESIAAAPIVAFDTEFVSEDSFLPELCLIQLAAAGRLAIVDPLEVRDLSPLWDILTNPNTETLVHAGREEFRFIGRYSGKRPARWFDVQIAAGLIGLEYPASYATLSAKLLGKNISKDETRTDSVSYTHLTLPTILRV